MAYVLSSVNIMLKKGLSSKELVKTKYYSGHLVVLS